jgi:hypothetical protein
MEEHRRGTMRRRLSGMPMQFSKLAKEASDMTKIDDMLSQMPVPPTTIPPPPSAKDAVGAVISTASKTLGVFGRLWGGGKDSNGASNNTGS